MQLVVRVERHRPPTESEVCATAARAVVALLSDPRSQPGGEWADAVARWRSGRIRKVVRRARAHAWERAHDIAGVTVTDLATSTDLDSPAAIDRADRGAIADRNAIAKADSATVAAVEQDGVRCEVRAFVPGPTDAVPIEVSRLQIRGLDLTDPDRLASVDADAVAPALVVALAPLESFSTGKKAAAAGHAAQLASEAMTEGRVRQWADAGWPVVCIQPGAASWDRLCEVAPVVVADAGFTEVAPGTVTSVALWS